jgi:hypothetical protein
MRPLLLLLAVAACGQVSRGPAWPKSTAAAEDGGESLAPRPSAHELDAPESIPADEIIAVTPDKPAEKPADKPADPAAAVSTPTEEPATTEEITIEVEDD